MTAPRSRTPHRVAAIASIGLIGATLSPLARDPVDDGYPLSTYPMFASARPTKLTMSYPLGVTADGGRRWLSPALIGSVEVLQARAIVERAVGRREELAALCAQIAKRVAAHPGYRDVTAIRFVTGTHDAVDFLVRDRLGPERDRGRCEVPRAAP
jgi:hypothetical protein